MLISSGIIPQEHEVIGLTFGFASTTEGCSGGIQVENTYQTALERLQESAKAQGANGLTFVSFQNRVAVKTGCGSATSQAFEVFAWGTAVKIKQS